MKRMKVLVLAMLCLSIISGFAQSLSIDETINYINIKQRENSLTLNKTEHNPYKSIVWDEINLTNDGKLSKSLYIKYDSLETIENPLIQEYCYLDDMQINNLKEYQNFQTALYNPNGFWCWYLNCKNNEPYVWQDDLIGKTFDNNKKGYIYTRAFELPHPLDLDLYKERKLCNAYKYLFERIYESDKYHRNDNDPFAPKNISKINSNNISSNNKTSNNISITKEGSLYYIIVKIGSIIKKFILDSGASELNISEDLEKQLVKDGSIIESDYLSNGLYKTANGAIIECRRVKLRNVTVGPFSVSNVTASISNDNSELLLGKSFLDKFKKWSIDNDKSELILEN
jgi:clan AA aspartic protease (TIGR02281 family)